MIESRKVLQNLDLFGVDIGLTYNNNRKFTSKLGGTISLILIGTLFALGLQLFFQIINKTNPNAIYQQMQVSNPSRYEVKKSKFSFAIQILKDGLTPYIDNTVFTIEGTFTVKTDVLQPDGSVQWDFKTTQLVLAPCTKDNFQLEEIQDYFNNLSSSLCIQNQDDIFLVGQWEKPLFSDVKLKFKECSGANCKDPQTRKEIIQKAKIQVYFTDRILDQQNFEKPFTSVGKSLFYNIFYDFFTDCGILFQTKHVYDDVGLIGYQEKKQSELFFSKDRVQLNSKVDDYFFMIAMYLEKDKEDKFIRTYLKLPSMISQLGGIFNVLFLVGSLLSKPYNKLQLLRHLFDDIFIIEQQRKGVNDNGKSRLDEENLQQSQQQKQLNNNHNRNNNNSHFNHKETLSSKIYYFIYSQLQCFKCFQNEVIQSINLGQNKLNQYISIDYLINKLVEFESVKNIILHTYDHDQYQSIAESQDPQKARQSQSKILSKDGKKQLYIHEKAALDYFKELQLQGKFKRASSKMQQQQNQKENQFTNSCSITKVNSQLEYPLVKQISNYAQADEVKMYDIQNFDSDIANENQTLSTILYSNRIPGFIKKVNNNNQSERNYNSDDYTKQSEPINNKPEYKIINQQQ